MVRSCVLVLVLAGTLLAGCFGGGEQGPAPPGQDEVVDWPRCEHPWPCADGSEWPPNLTGPFDILAPIDVRITSHDGVVLHGSVWLPDVPDGVRVPVVVQSSPYFSQNYDNDPTTGGRQSTSGPAQMDLDRQRQFPENGFALLLISVRGTGESGGCLGWSGADEIKDHGVIVDWAAQQAWSNGRVGFWGVSYEGMTPWEAAMHGQEALKAIWAGGVITDWYSVAYDLQGLALPGYMQFTLDRFVGIGTPNWPAGVPAERQPAYLMAASERICEGTPEAFTRQAGTTYSDERYPEWFEERRLLSQFDEVTAAVLVPQGLQDNAGHRFQEDVLWDALPNAPKWFLLGQWGHTYDFDEQLSTYPYANDTIALTQQWFDFWLKGIGEAPRIDVVDYQLDEDGQGGEWMEASHWPPPSKLEALRLGGAALGNSSQGSVSFTAAAIHSGTSDVHNVFPGTQLFGCEDTDLPPAVFASERVTARIAGNPYARLDLDSDQPGGGFEVWLLSSSTPDPCASLDDLVILSRGGVDLRFHDGDYLGTDFPTSATTQVRVDLHNVAADVDDRHLVLVLRAPQEPFRQPWNPTVTVHGTSELVLPLVGGTVEGSPPSGDVPPRPRTS